MFTFFTAPLSAWRSRQQEFEADAYAVAQTPALCIQGACVRAGLFGIQVGCDQWPAHSRGSEALKPLATLCQQLPSAGRSS